MRWLLALVFLMVCSSVRAEGPVYGEVQLGAGGVQHSELDFFPLFGTLSVGAYVLPNIGIEVFADAGLLAGEDENFDLNIEQAYGIAARFQSPPMRGLQGFIVLGAVNYTIDQQFQSPGVRSVNEEFTGARVSIGLMQRLTRLPGVLFTAEYRHYNADTPLRMDALVVGWRFNAP